MGTTEPPAPGANTGGGTKIAAAVQLELPLILPHVLLQGSQASNINSGMDTPPIVLFDTSLLRS